MGMQPRMTPNDSSENDTHESPPNVEMMTTFTTPPDWHFTEPVPALVYEYAECKNRSHLFFNTRSEDNPRRESGRWERIRQAKEICDQCFVRDDCLGWALRNKPHGIWGGTTERERKKMLKQHSD